MPTIAEILATFVHDLELDAVPASARHRATLLMLDGAGIGLAASTFAFARQAVGALATFEPGDCPVIGFRGTLPLRDAVLANGILVHGLDYDDTHTRGVVHATASCLPTALGLGWALRRTGRDVLAAYIAGMEAAARLGTVARGELNQIGFHPTGVIAAFACALVAGRLAGLSPEALVMAQGIVLSMAAGTREYSTDGADSKRMHPGWAGACGITAARLAAAGFTGPRTAYEGRFGLYKTHLQRGDDWDLGAATRDLGRVWEVEQVALKPFPACQLSIASIDAAIGLARERPIDPDAVRRIEARVPPHAVQIVCEPVATRRRPHSAYSAQFSIQYAVACALARGRFSLADLEDHHDPALLALADKVEYSVDHDTNYPVHFSGEVVVTMQDGSERRRREPINLGGADKPLSDDDIARKFMENACLGVPTEQAARLRDLVLGIADLADGGSVARELAGPRDFPSATTGPRA